MSHIGFAINIALGCITSLVFAAVISLASIKEAVAIVILVWCLKIARAILGMSIVSLLANILCYIQSI